MRTAISPVCCAWINEVSSLYHAAVRMVLNEQEDEVPVPVTHPFMLPHEFLADMFQTHWQ